MADVLFLDQSKCTGCRICESVCSMANEGVLNKAKSRIKIRREDVLSLNPLYCDQCEERPCLAACPENAFIVKNGMVRIKASLCNGCGRCAQVCDRIFFLPGSGRAIICIQCGRCVSPCPEDALAMRKR